MCVRQCLVSVELVFLQCAPYVHIQSHGFQAVVYVQWHVMAVTSTNSLAYSKSRAQEEDNLHHFNRTCLLFLLDHTRHFGNTSHVGMTMHITCTSQLAMRASRTQPVQIPGNTARRGKVHATCAPERARRWRRTPGRCAQNRLRDAEARAHARAAPTAQLVLRPALASLCTSRDIFQRAYMELLEGDNNAEQQSTRMGQIRSEEARALIHRRTSADMNKCRLSGH